MVAVRFFRTEELPAILQCSLQTALGQLVARDLPQASPAAVAGQIQRMFDIALQAPGGTILVVDWPPGMTGDGPAGYTLLMPQQNSFTRAAEVIVLDIYTAPALRGRKVGRALLTRAEEYARAVGSPSVVAQVALHNHASLALFMGAGYQLERVVVGKPC